MQLLKPAMRFFAYQTWQTGTRSQSFMIPIPPLRQARIALIALYLYLIAPRGAIGEDHISVKWQDYAEDDDRIRVISRYLGFEKQIGSQFVLKGHGVHDAISGATPTGTPAGEDGQVPLSTLTDIREAGVVDLDWIHGIHTSSVQFSYSAEDDFLSRGYAYSQTTEINQRNTGINYGIGHIDDLVRPSFLDESRRKDSYDYFVGISQVVDPNTIVALNFTYSDYNGFLSDPYKIIQRETEILPGLSLPLTFPENRPDSRDRRIWFFNAKRYFDKIGASLDFDYRHFSDSWGVESNTFDFEWYQKLGENLILRPKYRYYSQNAADFYTLDLSGTPIDPRASTSGIAPHYSADYRLGKFDTHTYGLKIIYKFGDKFSIDGSYERYEMEGKDDTPQSAFADADVITLGATVWF